MDASAFREGRETIKSRSPRNPDKVEGFAFLSFQVGI